MYKKADWRFTNQL